MAELVSGGAAQFIVATHSPILMTFPGATIVSFDDPSLPNVKITETSHYNLTRDILGHPEVFWQHLRKRGPA